MKFNISKLKAAGALAVAAVSNAAMAQTAPPAATDLSSLTDAVDMTTVGTAVLAIAGALIVVYVAIKGAKIVISMVKGA